MQRLDDRPPHALNHLAHEKSPYLVQHAHNPVDWYPWGEEAFERARVDDKPIFLSIGYATCHWCHVMAHESFEDPIVARLMNEAFVNVKVDREERPDVDGVYMTACQLVNRSCGWPLTVVMTPDREPFYVATYLPREGRWGRPGMLDLIPRLRTLWRDDRQGLQSQAKEITRHLRRATASLPAGTLDEHILRAAYDAYAKGFDRVHGGLAGRPKFPQPHHLLLLLRLAATSASGPRSSTEGSSPAHAVAADEAVEMVRTTLSAMRRGGIYDHVGFGFHRYATDERWFLPHFEKMLYDQALHLMAYSEAYLLTGDPSFDEVAREIAAYVARVMTSPEGGFYSAEDADSEGEEGKFYVWTAEELRAVLGDEGASFAMAAWAATEAGTYLEEATGTATGANILALADTREGLAHGLDMTPPAFDARLEEVRATLFRARETRVHPLKDDKVLTDWNGLMIAALAKSGRALGEPDHVALAKGAADFVLSTMRTSDGRLLHRYREGDAAIEGTLDDYAFMAWGLVELYQATFDTAYLAGAVALTEAMVERFWDEVHGGFFSTREGTEDLLVRRKDAYDGAIPSGNGVAMVVLTRLGHLTGRSTFDERASQLAAAFASSLRQNPLAHTVLLMGLVEAQGPSFEVVVAGNPDATDTRQLLQLLAEAYLPTTVVIQRPLEGADDLIALAPYTLDQLPLDGRATAYVCTGGHCTTPVTSPSAMIERLEVTART